ncbi:hypothetical protein NQ315_005947 [Exocentrus adspersus]|uniref:Uncharacterized protein n=1 Tax=Exocentrus adspersus TaxID=1586481 RepID=A0AAV8VB21_9CUCU|nr:hypothetical protein NQ315_005947 [Exocentrus adspersus]
MKLLLQVVDYVVFHLLWFCHVIYNRIDAVIRGSDNKKDEAVQIRSENNGNGKRHFIHLYTTSGNNGRPICYMDVYEIFSPMDEKKLRYAASKGILNKTYMKYNHGNAYDTEDKSQDWLEYSTLTL